MSAATELKARLRVDLRSAMKERRSDEAKVIRELIAAIDNAEAPPLSSQSNATDQHRFETRSAEIDRLALSGDRVRAVLLSEIEDRERAADQFDGMMQAERASALREQASFARRYLD